MLFVNKKKIITMLLVSMLCVFTFSFAVYADENDIDPSRASEYIRSTSVNVIPQGDGVLLLENKLGATRIVDKLGIISLEVQTKINGYWQTIDTLVTDDYRYDAATYIYDTYYYGATPGKEYRSYVEFYVEDDGGSETRIVVSSPKTAE